MRGLFSVCALMVTAGCWGSRESPIFSDLPSGGAGGSGTAGSQQDPGGTGPSGGAAGGGSSSFGSSSATSGTGGGGTSAAGTGGTVTGGTGAATAGDGGGSGQANVPHIEDCSMLDRAETNPLNGHCYRVDYVNLSFAAARSKCAAAGGHLASISSEEENKFVAKLHDGEHWIGATDGRGDSEPGAGPYGWVSGEEWTYSNWDDGQPNAFETDCPEPSDPQTDCFEHCAFQNGWGGWKDRSCWHTIGSICEWDVDPPEMGGGGAASGGQPGL